MKKILALVMALVMVLGVASAMAEGSKQTPGGGGTTVETPAAVTVEYAADTEVSKAVIGEFEEAAKSGDVLALLPDAIKAAIPGGYNTINEMVTAEFVGDVNEVADYSVMNFTFETKYVAGSTVIVLVGILPATVDGEIEWYAFNGSVLEDGSVNVTLPKEIFTKAQNDPFILSIVSAQ